jgi:putative nucleotidyltransferase with HDIG domain
MAANGDGRKAEAAAFAVVAKLRSEGFQAYYAGGCVRDLLLGHEPADFDVATDARPELVLRMFPRTFSVGAHFGVVLVPAGESGREFVTEVATFRSDGAYSDGRRPDEVNYSTSPEEDVKRRDFTINGMLLDPLLLDQPLMPKTDDIAGAVLDFVGGRRDMEARLVRAIGDAHTRFSEDKLRMLRAVRFAARFGFAIEPVTAAAIRAQASDIALVSRERIRDELNRMLTEGHAKHAFALLDETGLLHWVLPEIERMKGVEQPPQYHPEGDVFVHTLLLLEKLEAGCTPTLAWGALLHDVGKPATFRRAPERIRFDGHVEVGVKITEDICARLRFSNEDTVQIVALVENHMRFGDVEKMKVSTLKRFFRLPRFAEHLALHRLDCLSSHGGLELYDYARERYETMPAEVVRPNLLVTGRDLITAGYRPGEAFKEMLGVAEDAQLEGRIHTAEEGLALLRQRYPLVR